MLEIETLSRPPTFMRYQRVEHVLEQEPRFKAQMTTKSEVVLKPNGDKQLFSPVVIKVTEAIHQSGQDAHKSQKMDIIRVAMDFMRSTPDAAPARTAPVAQPTQAPAPAPAPAPRTAKLKARVVAATPAAAPATATKAVQAKAKVAVKKAPVAKAPESGKNGDCSVEVEEAPPSRAAIVEAPPAEVRRSSTSDPAYNPYISIFTNLLSALQLAENFDNQPGKDKRLKTLDDLAVEYRKFTGIPRHA